MEPFDCRKDEPLPPAAKVTAAGVFNVPLLSTTAPTFGSAIPPVALVAPGKPSVPPDQVSNPDRFNVLVDPAIVPPLKFSGPAIVTGLASLKLMFPFDTFVGPVTL